jgi:hypothetical protein
MENAYGVDFLPQDYVDISDEIDIKEKALACHKSQVDWLRDHDNFDLIRYVRLAGEYRGVQCGAKFAEGFRKLDADMREGVLDYLSDMALFEEITVKDEAYVIVHAGIRNFSEDVMLDELAPEDFIFESLDPEREYYEDKTIIAGHIHTNELPDPDPDMIYYGNGTIFLDCGSDKNGTLGCLCLDNGKEYYVH